jgi:hypothetical protein
MDYRLLIVVDSRSPPHRDAITAFLRDLGYECWHWIDHLWLLTEGRPVYWGGNEAESWSWLLEHWGRPDFPRPLPSPVVLA